jgi:ribonuclease HI/DNA polymerase-3 subunit epsilon
MYIYDIMTTFYLYTDGSAFRNGYDGPMGWAYAIYPNENNNTPISVGSGGALVGTNNRAEILGIINGIRACMDLDASATIIVYSDSMYCINSITLWMDRWVRQQFKGIKNPDLWQEYLLLVGTKTNIHYNHVRGHSGDPRNNYVDMLSRAETVKYQNAK